MAKKNNIFVKDTNIKTLSENGIDYICITDIARQKNDEDPNGVISNWMRNRNTVEFLGIWEELYNPRFNPLEFEGFRKEAGLNAFTLSPTKWVDATNAVGMKAISGRYGGTYQRNPQMAIFAMNTMPFRGLGSGIVRILQEETDIILENDTTGKEFKVIIPRHDNVSITDTEEQSIVDKLSIRKIIVDKLSINEGLVDKLSINEGFTDKLVEIFLYINDNPHTTTEAISVFIGKGVSRTKNYMQALTELGLVCAEGGNKNRTFIVNRIKN